VTVYLGLADYLLIAERVLGLPAEVIGSGWFLTRCQHKTAAFVAKSG
jgi:hypothetical protein